MQSYYLGTLKRDKPTRVVGEDLSTYGKSSYFAYTPTREVSIIKHLESFGVEYKSDPRLVTDLANILEKYSLNARMLVAVNFWYTGNGKPKQVTYSMFENNRFFIKVLQVFNDEDKNIKYTKDFIVTFITYTHILKKELYSTEGKIRVVEADEESEYGYDEDESEQD